MDISLLGKRSTKFFLALMLTAALACAAVLVVGSAPAHAAKPLPDQPLVIDFVYPQAGAANVSTAGGRGVAFAEFNTLIDPRNVDNKIRLTNVDTGKDVTGVAYWDPDHRYLVGPVDRPSIAFECGTTYEVTVRHVKSLAGAKLSDVPDGVTLERGKASWTFTTVTCA
jgi:hypothetical protein